MLFRSDTLAQKLAAEQEHIEGALSGLPILYVESGGITEYCKNYGIQYTVDNLEEKLAEIKNKFLVIFY